MTFLRRKAKSALPVAIGASILAAILMFFTNTTPQTNGLNRSDARCLNAYTSADLNAIIAAMNSSGRAPADLFNHAFNRLGHGPHFFQSATAGAYPVLQAYWDPAQTGDLNTTLRPDGLTLVKSDSSGNYATTASFANRYISTGKWYFEIRVLSMTLDRQRIGIGSREGRHLEGPGSADYSVGMDFNGTYSVHTPAGGYVNRPMPTPIPVKAGDLVAVAVDLDNLKISFYVNDALSGTVAIPGRFQYSPMMFASRGSGYTIKANFGRTHFRYAPPAGYSQLDQFYPVPLPVATNADTATRVINGLKSGTRLPAATQSLLSQLFPLHAQSDARVMWNLIDLYEQRNKFAPGSTDYQRLNQATLDYRNAMAEEVAAKGLLASALHPDLSVGEMQIDFWFNHFSVFSRDTNATAMAYENMFRDRHCGTFSELLLANARSPAMLTYLGNYLSVGRNSAGPLAAGINENYAREIMELHTFGVGPTAGVYNQASIREVAKILTGWTVRRSSTYNPATPGSTYQEFTFNSSIHYPGAKTVPFGSSSVTFPDGEAGGIQLIGYLANHAQTKKNICTKLGKRLMSAPPSTLVTKCIQAWTASGGSIPRLMMAYLSSPEFWADTQKKLKNPYELVISTHRALGKSSFTRASVLRDLELIRRLGMRMKGLLPPTGYSEESSDWLSSGYVSTSVGIVNEVADLDRGALSDPTYHKGAVLEAITRELSVVDPLDAYDKMALDVLPMRFESALTPEARALLQLGVRSTGWDRTTSGTVQPARTYSTLLTGSRWFFAK